jgi:hypothetical protein
MWSGDEDFPWDTFGLGAGVLGVLLGGAGIAFGKLESGIPLAGSGAAAIWIALVRKRSAPDPWADDENDDAEAS